MRHDARFMRRTLQRVKHMQRTRRATGSHQRSQRVEPLLCFCGVAVGAVCGAVDGQGGSC